MEEKEKKNRYKDGRWKDGNVAAEKWTADVVKKRLKRMLKRLHKDEEGEICALIILAEKENLYLDWFNHMRSKFKENSEITEMLDMVQAKTEGRLFNKALKREVDSYVALFGLRAYYNRHEKQVIENDNRNEGKLDITLNYANKKDDK